MKFEVYEHITIFEMKEEKDVKNYFYSAKEWKLIETIENVTGFQKNGTLLKIYLSNDDIILYPQADYKFKLINEETK